MSLLIPFPSIFLYILHQWGVASRRSGVPLGSMCYREKLVMVTVTILS